MKETFQLLYCILEVVCDSFPTYEESRRLVPIVGRVTMAALNVLEIAPTKRILNR